MGGVLRSLLYTLLIPVPVAAAEALLESLRDKTHPLIQRTTPCTWEELRAELERQLVPILLKLWEPLGGLMPIPTIELPDGVVSTSLVSQSEMVQFVTNTLNVWQAKMWKIAEAAENDTIYSFQPLIVAAKYVPAQFGPDINPVVFDPTLAKPAIATAWRKAINIGFDVTNTYHIEPTITVAKEV